MEASISSGPPLAEEAEAEDAKGTPPHLPATAAIATTTSPAASPDTPATTSPAPPPASPRLGGWAFSSFPLPSFTRRGPFASSSAPAAPLPAPSPTTTAGNQHPCDKDPPPSPSPAAAAVAASTGDKAQVEGAAPGTQQEGKEEAEEQPGQEEHRVEAQEEVEEDEQQKQEQEETESEKGVPHVDTSSGTAAASTTAKEEDGHDPIHGGPRRLGEWLWAGMRGYYTGPGALVGGVGAGVGMVVGLPLNLAGRFSPWVGFRTTHPLHSGGDDGQSDGEEAALIAACAHDFNERLLRPDARPLLDQITAFVAGHDAGVGLEEQGRALHAFVDSMEAQMAVHPLWSHLPVDSGRALLVECLERHLTHTLHSRIFLCGPSAARQDEDLFRRILSLQFIGTRQLGLPAGLARVSLESAQEALFTINSKRSPYEKTCCLLRCARNLLRKLAEASNRRTEEIGADDFLPGLIYLLLKSNPPLLHSNLRYISCFRHPARAAGEGAYYLVHFVSAVSFIENLDAALLNMDPADFELGLSDPDAFAERERQRDAEEEEEARRRQEEEAAAALRRSDSDSDELEGDVSSWVYLNKKVPGQDLVVHHAGTQTDISAFATSSADNTTVDEANEEEGQEDRFLDVEAEQLGAADVAELLQRYKLLVERLRQA